MPGGVPKSKLGHSSDGGATVEDESYLGNLGQQIKEHWRKYRPRMFGELDQAAALDEAVHLAEALTVAAYDQAIDAGLVPDQARELVREEWAFLPDEDDVRQLAPERDPQNLVSWPSSQWSADGLE
jgi:hypothetical protein